MNSPVPQPSADYDSLTLAAREKLFAVAAGYLASQQLMQLERACAYAFIAHKGQTRKSGEPYITHPIAVTEELAKWHMDIETLCAGLMHDVLEDTKVTFEDMKQQFGNKITELVDGVSKLDKFEYADKQSHQAASFRKLVMAMTRDVRVIIVKLSDRLHNMRTLGGVQKVAKRRSTAQETLDIFAPIALRLGLNHVYREMQDLAFVNIYPQRYHVLQKTMAKFRIDYQSIIREVETKFSDTLQYYGVEARIIRNEKHLYSIYRKMQDRNKKFEQVNDIFGFQIIVNKFLDCYTVMGILHSIYQPDIKRIKDHIAIPKSNNYQSLHTTLRGPQGLKVEVQIRTQEMQAIAENGIAAILADSKGSIQRTQNWLQTIMDLQHNSADAAEFMENVKTDLFANEVYVYTPRGKIITLPRGATPIDFAYAIHTDVGNHCVGAQINGVNVPLRTKLRNGDQVHIMTSSYGKPNPIWLDFAVSGRARSAIRYYIKSVDRQNAIALGEALFNKALLSLLPDEQRANLAKSHYCQQYNLPWNEVCYQIGTGKLLAVSAALEAVNQKDLDKRVKLPLTLDTNTANRVHLAECCQPIPDDAIRVVMDKQHGLTVHREDCVVLLDSDFEQQFEADWRYLSEDKKRYDTEISVCARDRHGLLMAISREISEAGGYINRVESIFNDAEQLITFNFELQVSNLAQLCRITQALSRLDSMQYVRRIGDNLI